MNDDWRERAACKGATRLFYPAERDDSGDYRLANKIETEQEAKRICEGCPVKSSCLEESLKRKEWLGIRAGMSGSQRKRYAQRRKN